MFLHRYLACYFGENYPNVTRGKSRVEQSVQKFIFDINDGRK